MPADDRRASLSARLKTEIWVKAYLRKLAAFDVWAAVIRRGDPDAGIVFVTVNLLDGNVRIFGPAIGGGHTEDGDRQWSIATRSAGVSEAEAAEFFARQSAVDPDFWVVELESPSGESYLDNIVTD